MPDFMKSHLFLVCFTLAFLAVFLPSAGAQGTGAATIDWTDSHQRIDGFGGCSAWMNSISDSEADALFSTNGKGIGLSLLRSRIAPGGGSTGETSIMQKAVARGARCWSAPWSPQASFKSNNNTSNGGEVLRNNYQAYANQLATYVLNQKNAGINLYAISINNEPTARPTFESCVWTAQQMHDFVPFLYNALIAKGVGSTKIMLPENQHWDVTLANKTMNDPVTAAMVGVLAAHDYAGSGPGPLQNLSSPGLVSTMGKDVWQTEFASTATIDTIDIAVKIHSYMTSAEANAWHSWWLNDSGSGGLLRNGSATTQMYAIGNFSRFVRPNYYRIGVTNNSGLLISAYKDWQSPKFAIVAVNTSGADVTQTFTLSGTSTVSSVVPWLTSLTQGMVVQPAVTVSGQSFSYTVPNQSVITFAGQAQASTGPYVTPMASQTVSMGNPTLPLRFTIGDPSASVSSLAISTSTSNGTLVPAGNIVIGGTAANRTLTVTPANGQTGTVIIGYTVSNATSSTTQTFLMTVVPPPPVLLPTTAVATGKINTAATWGGSLPVLGDQNNWRSSNRTLSLTTSPDVFNGGTLVLQAGGKLAPGIARTNLTLNNVVMDGGQIYMGNNLAAILNLSGKTFTLNSCSLRSGAADSMDVVIENCYLAGTGSIDITSAIPTIAANRSQVQFQTSNYTSGFTGIFNIRDYGFLDLPPIAISEASFGLSISSTGLYNNEYSVAVTSLVIDGTSMPYGVYHYSDFSLAQQAFISKSSGVITVVPSGNQPPTISTIAPRTLNENETTGAIVFSVADPESQPSTLVVTAKSSNQVLLPDANIVLGGSGTNRTVTATPAANQSGTATITLTVSDGIIEVTSSFALTVLPTNDPPTISAISSRSIACNTSTGAIAFTIGDPETPASSLTLSVKSDNPALIPPAGLIFGGSGANRTLTVVPSANRSGSAMVTVNVADESLETSRTFQISVTPAPEYTAVASGTLDAPATWPGVLPTVGDANNWRTGVWNISQTSATQTFPGLLLTVTSGSQLAPALPAAVLTTNNLVLDGGTIYMGNNVGLIIDLGGKVFTLNSGTLKSGGDPSRDVRYRNGYLSGTGVIGITAISASGADVEFISTLNTRGFQGIFDVKQNGILKLAEITPANASFGITLSGTGKLANVANVALTSLNIAGTSIPIGTYAVSDFSLAQQAYFASSTGIITVVAPNSQTSWRANYFGTTASTGMSADDADPDSDGESNLLEFATSQNPLSGKRLVTPVVTDGSSVEFSYLRSLAGISAGMIYQVEWSDDLSSGSWNSTGVSESVISSDTTSQSVRVSVPKNPSSNLFMRLRVISP